MAVKPQNAFSAPANFEHTPFGWELEMRRMYGRSAFSEGIPTTTHLTNEKLSNPDPAKKMLSTSHIDHVRGSGRSFRPVGGAGFNPTSGWNTTRTSNPFEAQAFGSGLDTIRRLGASVASMKRNVDHYTDIFNTMNQLPTITPATSGGGGTGGGGTGGGGTGGGGTGGGGNNNQPPAVPVTIRGRNRPVETGATLIQRRQAVKSAMASSPFAPINVNNPSAPRFDASTNTWVKPGVTSAFDPTPTPPWAEDTTPTPSPFFTPSPQKTGNEVVADPSSWTPPMTIKPLPQTQPAQQEEASPKPAPKQRKARIPKKPKAPKES